MKIKNFYLHLIWLFENKCGTFFKDYPPPVFVDEIQYAPKLFQQIKIIIDREKKKGQFFMTGSQQFHLIENISESLAGRLGLLMLLGLSMREKQGIDFSEPFLPTDEYFSIRNLFQINSRNRISSFCYQCYPSPGKYLC